MKNIKKEEKNSTKTKVKKLDIADNVLKEQTYGRRSGKCTTSCNSNVNSNIPPRKGVHNY